MLLAIDAGNTNIVFAVYDGQEQLEQCRLETTGNIPEVMSDIAQKYPDISDVIISSVVPKINDALEKSCTYLLKTDPVFVTHENAGIKIDIDKPEQLGADRIVGAVAAVNFYQTPAIVVDFGTSTNFDVINAEGAHCGGVLATGAKLSLAALVSAAEKLSDIAIEQPGKVIGRNTVDAMQSGIYHGYISMVEGMVQKIAAEMGVKPFVIATGGLATLFDKGTDVFDVVDPDLLMKGLVRIHEQILQSKSRKSA